MQPPEGVSLGHDHGVDGSEARKFDFSGSESTHSWTDQAGARARTVGDQVVSRERQALDFGSIYIYQVAPRVRTVLPSVAVRHRPRRSGGVICLQDAYGKVRGLITVSGDQAPDLTCTYLGSGGRI